MYRKVRRGVVSDPEVLYAMRVTVSEFRFVLEPGGAVAPTALLARGVGTRSRTTLFIDSGGNVNAGLITNALSQG